MSAFYDRLARTAASLLLRFGQPVVLRVVGAPAGVYDTDTGTNDLPAPVDTTYNGAVFSMDGETEKDGTLVEAGDQRCLLEPSAAPTVDDKLLVGGVEYAILGIKTVKPGGTSVVHSLHLRR